MPNQTILLYLEKWQLSRIVLYKTKCTKYLWCIHVGFITVFFHTWCSVLDPWQVNRSPLTTQNLFPILDIFLENEQKRPESMAAISFPSPRDIPHTGSQIQVSHIAGRFFTSWATARTQLPPLLPPPSFQKKIQTVLS